MGKPKYLIIKENILALIDGQEPNTPILSEREIALKYDASRMTVRRAVEEVVEDGYLYRDKNKGTFVADEKLRKKTNAVLLYEEEANTHYKILFFDMYFDIESRKDEGVYENLDIEPGDLFLRVVRLQMKGEEPISIEEIYIARKNVTDENLVNLKDFLNFDKYISEGSMNQVFIPMIVPTQYANLMHLKLDTPIIRVDNLIAKRNGQPFMFIKSYCNPNKKKIEITL